MTEYSYENQPYLADLLKLAAASGSGVHHVMIEHDDWCPALQGTGLCICNPIVRRPNRKERRRLKLS